MTHPSAPRPAVPRRALLQGSAPTVAGANPDYVATAAPANSCTYTYQRDGANDAIVYNTSTGEVTRNFN